MRLATLGALLVCLTVGAQASVIIFSDGFNGSSVPGTFQTLTAGQTLGPWTVSGGGIDWVGGYWQAKEGNGSIDLSGNRAGTIAKTTLPTTAGETYVLSFWLAGNPDDGAVPKKLMVTVGDQQDLFTFPGGGTLTNMGWIQETLSFTALGNDTLSFASDEFSAFGPALDGVTVASATPEPASMLMAGLGLLSIGGLLKLRRRLQK